MDIHHCKVKTDSMKVDIQQVVGGQSVFFSIYMNVSPEGLETFERARGLEKTIKREIRDVLRQDPDVLKKTPLIIVDCGWDSISAARYRAKSKTIHIEVYFLPIERNLPWERTSGIAREILKGVEATILRVLLDNNQVIIPQK